MNAAEPHLLITQLVKRYGNVFAVNDISVEVRRGEFLTLLGPSGSGKTTTLSIIAGFEEQTSGEILLEGKPLTPVPPHERNIGMVFQRYTLFPNMSVFDNVAFPLSVRGRPKPEIFSEVKHMLRLVRLDGFGDRRPDQLSGGQQQRVALARALIYRPQILLMDEPLGALDKKLREEIQAEIRRIHQELAVTIVYVTHDQEEALRLSDRICLFSYGRIIQIGTGEDLYERPASAFVASFVGSSNFMEIDVEAASGKTVASRLPDGTAIYAQRGTRPTAGSKARLMVRPERMQLAQTRKNGASDSVIDVTILDATYLGDTIHYDVGTRWGQTLAVRQSSAMQGGETLAPGSAALLHWSSMDAHIFDLEMADRTSQ